MYFYCYVYVFVLCMYVPCWIFCFIVLFYVMFVCLCVQYYRHCMSTQLNLANISYQYHYFDKTMLFWTSGSNGQTITFT